MVKPLVEKLSAVNVGAAAALALAVVFLAGAGCVTMSDLLQANSKVLADSAPMSAVRREILAQAAS